MTDAMIQVENLSKRYRIGLQEEQSDTLAGALIASLRAPLRNWRYLRNLSQFGDSQSAENDPEDIIWALRDVSFEVRRGEVIGIIGRNGAGKSTLLKIISRITEPTSGRVRMRGRVSSLLEVGTGFHPELTGRENVYMNGTILGMRKAEIDRKFAEIVDFSGVAKFLDTPVKRYSSGMKVRLAFAVAAHLEPEILIIDEVLAVGDAEFQKKCLGKMGDVAGAGRTVLFVSHNMAAIESLCQRVIVLERGSMVAQDTPSHAIKRYLQSSATSDESSTDLENHAGRPPDKEVVLRTVRVLADGQPSTELRMGGALTICTTFKRAEPITHMRLGIPIENHLGQRVIFFSPSLHAPRLIQQPLSEGTITCQIPCLPLIPGLYYVTLILGMGSVDIDRVDQAVQFRVESSDVFGTGYAPLPRHGVFYAASNWSLEGS